jgi:hypothetical protein
MLIVRFFFEKINDFFLRTTSSPFFKLLLSDCLKALCLLHKKTVKSWKTALLTEISKNGKSGKSITFSRN